MVSDGLRAAIVLILADMVTELYTISLEFCDALYAPLGCITYSRSWPQVLQYWLFEVILLVLHDLVS